MNHQTDLATQALSWVVAPLGILVAAWIFIALLHRTLRALTAALAAAFEARRARRECRKLEANLAPGEQPPQHLVWLRRDRERARAEIFEEFGSAGVSLAKTLVPTLVIAGLSVVVATPWQPAASPLVWIDRSLNPPDTTADNSIQFLAEASVRYQAKLSELEAKITQAQTERDTAQARLAAARTTIANAELTPSQRAVLLAAIDRPANTPPVASVPTAATTGAPATSIEVSSNAPTTPAPTMAPSTPKNAAVSPKLSREKAARYREIVKELTTRWAACGTELQAIAERGPDGEKFANWVQPRLISLIRSESEKETDTVLRELLAAFDTEKRLVSSAATLPRIDQLLRQLDLLIHGT